MHKKSDKNSAHESENKDKKKVLSISLVLLEEMLILNLKIKRLNVLNTLQLHFYSIRGNLNPLAPKG